MSDLSSSSAPARRSGTSVRELTFRGIVLGGLMTLIFTAANVYLGLKVGLTFATSIPAAVISMAVLRHFKGHSVEENNIVQTIASAAGTLSAIIFVLPGLIMVGWWSGFPYWTTLAICLVGGILGVMYSIPLRRALVTGSDLPYPEGVAGAEVLKVGDSAGAAEANKVGLRVIIVGSVVSAAYALLSDLKLVKSALTKPFKTGDSSGSMVGVSMSMALIGVGHLVGIAVAAAILVGLFISYGAILPWRVSGKVGSDLTVIQDVFTSDVRFVGAGTIGVAAIWTLIKVIGPIVKGISDSISSSKTRHEGGEVPLTERDLPVSVVLTVVLISMIPIGFMLWGFARDMVVSRSMTGVIIVSLAFILLVGLAVASVCGYMAGLIGASNSPISGVGILVVLVAALLIKLTYGAVGGGETVKLVAYTLFTASIVFGIATISNDNLQDLKTGQLVGSTPWKQQIALIIGVIFGSAIIPPVMQLMQSAFGFQGAPGAGPNALQAPQATLISSLATGVFGGSLDWGLMGIGALVGIGVIVVDEILTHTTKKFSLPPLAVGMGMYLPMTLSLTIPIGAALGWLFDKWAAHTAGDVEGKKRTGILLATGLIVGESIFGVIYAAMIAAAGSEDAIAIAPESWDSGAGIVGVITFAAAIAFLYRWTKRQAKERVEA